MDVESMGHGAWGEERRAEKEESRDTQYAEISRQSNYPGGLPAPKGTGGQAQG